MSQFGTLIQRLDAASMRHRKDSVGVFVKADGQQCIMSADDESVAELQTLCNEAASLLRSLGVDPGPARTLGKIVKIANLAPRASSHYTFLRATSLTRDTEIDHDGHTHLPDGHRQLL